MKTDITYDIENFYQELVEHGLIIPVGVLGAFGRGKAFEDVLQAFDRVCVQLAGEEKAESHTYPPIIDRKVIEKAHYLDSFPHLCGAVHSFFGNAMGAMALAERANSGGNWGELLQQTELVLAPAACYPVYPALAAAPLPAGGRRVTLIGWVYRNEPSREPTRMQSFRVREIIRAGAADEVLAWRDAWMQKGMDLLKDGLGLPAAFDVAADPFFGRGGKMLAENQKQQKLKFEVLVPVISKDDPTAVCSFNYHQSHFGETYGIKLADGQPAHTACLGFGMERLTMALFKQHGFDVATWPASVRSLLSL